MAIHQSGDNRFVISTNGCWLEGVYESREAANYAFRFCCDLRAELQRKANTSTPNRVITLQMMKEMKAERGFLCGEGAHRPGWQQGDPLVFSPERQAKIARQDARKAAGVSDWWLDEGESV